MRDCTNLVYIHNVTVNVCVRIWDYNSVSVKGGGAGAGDNCVTCSPDLINLKANPSLSSRMFVCWDFVTKVTEPCIKLSVVD